MSTAPEGALLFAQVFVTVLVIMDPVASIPVFLSLTRNEAETGRRRAALQASAAAAAIILSFAVFGQQLLLLLGISLEGLQVSGGLLLTLVALELVHGTGESERKVPQGMNVALVPLGTPLLAGPGAIAATMVFIRNAGSITNAAIVVAALVAVLLVICLVLCLADPISRVVKPNGIALLSRVVGLLVAAIAVQLIATGVQSWIRSGV